jgi:hypothetical protein
MLNSVPVLAGVKARRKRRPAFAGFGLDTGSAPGRFAIIDGRLLNQYCS